MPLKRKIALISGAVLSVLFLVFVLVDVFIRVPDFTKLKDSVPVRVKMADGKWTTRMMGPRIPSWTPLSGISEWLPRAVVASEDASFYSHNGIDVFEMQEALKKDLSEGRIARGASTITQQVLKNVYLLRNFRVWRKVKELAWASKLEAALTKSQILAFYLNMAEWGPGIYGIGEASRHYFSTSPSSLTARQSAFLAMLLPSPRRYHSFFRERQLTEWASNRVNRILTVMNKMGQLPDEQYEIAKNEMLWGVPIVPDNTPGAPPDPGWGAREALEELFEPLVSTPTIPVVEPSLPADASTQASPVTPGAGPEPVAGALPADAPAGIEADTTTGGEPSGEKTLNSLQAPPAEPLAETTATKEIPAPVEVPAATPTEVFPEETEVLQD